MTVVERERIVTVTKLTEYIPMDAHLPMVVNTPHGQKQNDFGNEREIMYKILFDMRNDINDLKSLTSELIKNRGTNDLSNQEKSLINRIYTPEKQQSGNSNSLLYFEKNSDPPIHTPTIISNSDDSFEDFEDIEVEENRPESLSLQNNEKDLIIKA